VVIPTRDGAATLPALLDVLLDQSSPFEVEVLIIDSGSRDGTFDLCAERPVRLERIPPAQFDHGGTRNLGIRLATGDPIVLLTQDAIPTGRDFLERIVRPFEDPEVAGVYGRQIPRADCDVVTRRQLEGWLTGRPQPARAQRGETPLWEHPPFARYELCNFDNVCSALRRSAWEKIPFPETDFGEDVAWGKAVIEDGWAIVYEPRAAVEHSHRRSVVYEYRRTRICHRRLFELFEVATVPQRRQILRAALGNLRGDLPYVLRHAPRGLERLRQLARIAALSVVSPWAQNLGFRDALRAQGRRT
jgi:rhamnosyltransferase